MRQKFFRVLTIVLTILAAGIFAYPYFSRWYAGEMQAVIMQEYAANMEEATPAQRQAAFEEAVRYNERMAEGMLADESGLYFTDPFVEGARLVPVGYDDQLRVAGDRGIMAILELPTLRQKLPVYHGVAEEVLLKGVGHVPQSALPVGGKGTHAVLAGHRGMRGSLLFTNIDQLGIGDVFLIHVLDQTLAYEVDAIHTVEPHDIELLAPRAGEDLVTLSTCTPLAINSHRLLITAHRVAYNPFPLVWPDANTSQLLIALAILAVALVLLGLYLLIDRRRKKREEQSDLSAQSAVRTPGAFPNESAHGITTL